MPDIFDRGTLSSCDCGEFDLETFATYIPTKAPDGSLMDTAQYNIVSNHENGHWAHWNSTTIGALLTLMKYASERFVLDHVAALDMSEKRAIFEARRAGKPIFTIERPVGRSQEFKTIRQIWMDLLVSYTAILDSQRVSDLEWDISEAVGSALTDAMFWAHRLFSRTELSDRLWLDDNRAAYIGMRTEHLTTRCLYEAMGLGDELVTFAHSLTANELPSSLIAFGDLRRRRYESLIPTAYGLPHRTLAAALGTEDLPFPEAATTVSLLADFALNPPLPPFVAYNDADRPTWTSIYPPIRFLRASEVIRSSGFLPHEPTDSDIRDFFQQVSAFTGMPNPNNYCDGVFFSQPTPREDNFTFRSSRIGELDGDYISYLSWVQRGLWEVRKTNPGLLLLYGQTFFTDEFADSRYEKARLLLEGNAWFKAPIERLEDGALGHTSNMSNATAAQYLMSLGLYLSLHHLACRAGDLDIGRKIPVPDLAERLQKAKKVISASMGLDVW